MGTLTIFFDGQFWVGVALRESASGSEVARVIFGPEPSDAELVQWVHDEYRKLAFVPAYAGCIANVTGNPKRRQREARRLLEAPRTRTRAQEAFSLAMEASKSREADSRRADQRAQEERRYAQRVQRRKQRHRGR